MHFYYFICNFIISIYSKILACCYLKIRIQIKFIVLYCFFFYGMWVFMYVCICVCLSVKTVIQKIRNILTQNFGHTFAIAQGRVD